MHGKQTREDRKCGLRLLRMGCILTTFIVQLRALVLIQSMFSRILLGLSNEHIKQLDDEGVLM